MQRQRRSVATLRTEVATSAGHDTALAPDSLVVGGFFPTPLVSARLAGHEQINVALARTILDRRSAEPGVAVSNLGGWHSAELLSWSGPEGERVIAAAREIADAMTLMEAGDELVAAEIGWRVAAWANVSDNGGAHRPHAHAGAFWSGTYWVDDGGAAADPDLGGLLEISDPRGVLPSMNAPHLRYAVRDCLSAGRGEVVTPQAGTLVVFPAWLVHSVTMFRGTRPRISIAFNFSVGG